MPPVNSFTSTRANPSIGWQSLAVSMSSNLPSLSSCSARMSGVIDVGGKCWFFRLVGFDMVGFFGLVD